MKCPNCGSTVPDDASFCPQCGSKTGAAQAVPNNPGGSPADMFRKPNDGGDDVEHQLWAGGYSAKAMIGTWLLGVIVTIALIVGSVMLQEYLLIFVAVIGVLWLLLVAIFAYRRLNYHYELTNQRFNHKTGILTRRSDRIETIDIDDVTFEQGLVQRMFGVGTIRISSSDRSHPEILIAGIDDVKRVADMIDDARRKERRKRGIHIESI